jgi:hypothetical protein
MEYAKETRKQANVLFKAEMIKKVEEFQLKKENDLQVRVAEINKK